MKRDYMWIVRESKHRDAGYLVCASRPKRDADGWYDPAVGDYCDFCESRFEGLTGLKLKPGDPPVKMSLVKARKRA